MPKSVKRKPASDKRSGAPVKPKAGAWPADKIEQWPITKLLVYPSNPMIHTEDQILKIVASMKEFGWTNPCLVDETGVLIAGHGRLAAAQRLGWTKVPVMVARGWTKSQTRAFRILDNQLPRLAEFDQVMLRTELTDLKTADYPLELLGFDDLQLVTFMAGTGSGNNGETAPPVEDKAITQAGDLWCLGDHRILCGDARSREDVDRLLDGVTPDLANCDPPYGISVVQTTAVDGRKPFRSAHGRVHGLGKSGFVRMNGNASKAIIQTGVYAEVIGDDSTETAIAGYKMLIDVGVPTIVMWGGNYYANALPPSRCWFAWDKEVTGTFADMELAWTNCDQVARLFRHEWNGLMKASERGERRVHPTQKPVALAEWVIETADDGAKSMVDFYLGSGSTLIAAERRHIRHYGMELSPWYCDVSIRRWQEATKRQATLEGSGKTFEQVVAERKEAPKGAPRRKPRVPTTSPAARQSTG